MLFIIHRFVEEVVYVFTCDIHSSLPRWTCRRRFCNFPDAKQMVWLRFGPEGFGKRPTTAQFKGKHDMSLLHLIHTYGTWGKQNPVIDNVAGFITISVTNIQIPNNSDQQINQNAQIRVYHKIHCHRPQCPKDTHSSIHSLPRPTQSAFCSMPWTALVPLSIPEWTRIQSRDHCPESVIFLIQSSFIWPMPAKYNGWR